MPINSSHFSQWSNVTGLGSLFISRLKLKANYRVYTSALELHCSKCAMYILLNHEW